MAGIQGKSIASTYKDLLNVSSSTSNEGVTSSLKSVFDGDGTETAIQLSTTHLKIPSGKTLEIAGTLNSVDATLTGDLNVGDDLTVTDLISGNSLAVTVGSTFGGGYGSTGLSIQSDGDLLMNGNLTTDGTVTIGGETKIGGGYNDTGVTISASGSIQADGGLTIGGNSAFTGRITITGSTVASGDLTVGGGYGSVGSGGLTIAASGGAITTNGTITCAELKTSTGVVKSGVTDSPKIKFEKDNTNNQVVTTVVDDSGNDADVFTVTEDGVIEVKDKDGTVTFEVKDTGTVKYKSKTTTQLNSITGTPGELVFDSTIGNFRMWKD